MTQTTKFDPHAIIKWLAEAEWPCLIYHSVNLEPACVHSSPHCPSCQCRGTGIVVPFAALRVAPPELDLRPGPVADWVPEPNETVARWKVFAALPALIRHEVARHPDDVFQVAKVWVKETL